MAGNPSHNANSMETILTFENRNVSQWSMVWSTADVPGMDTGTGGGPSARLSGRRRLRIGTFVLGAFLTMHCRVTASAITGGFFIFLIFLTMAVALLANPLRHFEIYLGQWSISGPGRAFRIIPMFDGIGIAICIHAIVRAICCCTIAAITAIYVLHSVSDARLPFTYCRDFNLKSYEPVLNDMKSLRQRQSRWKSIQKYQTSIRPSTVGFYYRAWRNASLKQAMRKMKRINKPRQMEVCNETYPGRYPPVFNTPAYNFFYVEVVQLRPDFKMERVNIPLIISLAVVWALVWMVLLGERIYHGRLIWNNMISWFVVVPWVWAAILAIMALTNITAMQKILKKAFRLNAMEIVAIIADALEVALYIHLAGTGTELIHGKGLNHYASGHIDSHLNSENVWHSGLVLLLACLNSTNAAVCALVDYMQVTSQENHTMHESTLWIIPMYSKCMSTGSYSHLLSALTFGGLTFSYMLVAYVLLKTALHTIFEYRVKLVFIEQVVVALLILTGMGLSVIFATIGGIVLLETVDAMMTGVAMPLVCLLQLVGMLCVYRSRDFVSDMNLATEENACASRIGTQWQIIPFITIIAVVLKLIVLMKSELPNESMMLALAPLVAVLLAVPVRAVSNAVVFLWDARHGIK
ncbi:sodium- and chloride-dependent neutral and basic amino acid transporter B(0+)-like isoform X1 [Ostrinia nubilalis]|uniref:sodium- and chloride-dependent neutral and basic amino acid transporter B(0+)-like isoform X1 n=1 Tax=Ostrinia nubilalis TaxID=29057 RepID=UPI00308230FA